jgi:hypothetical protein
MVLRSYELTPQIPEKNHSNYRYQFISIYINPFHNCRIFAPGFIGTGFRFVVLLIALSIRDFTKSFDIPKVFLLL